ncbi:hypothetical protein C7974DRAFT_425938 [Boeremia exigua]|uniref:uncharacterized protein n=1 Tax=Boeremia exigua TaxID=749465 RepID=UPI001E8D7AD8|nr:uncharacterized protein C7974DRAFT_425938 [Boeremia exigua]KAH6622237.1 hypothetical protein C7974DRAFT_425938 [Boeremia exigua]
MLVSAQFKNLPPQQPVPPPPPYKVQVSPLASNMVFHNNRLVEIPLFDDSEPPRAEEASRTSAGEASRPDETPDNKRKRKEALKYQTLHEQTAVDSASAADMDNIHFSEPFEGFNFASSTDYNRTAPFYNYPRNHPWLQATYDDVFYDDDEDAVFNNGQTFCGNDHGFYDIGMPDSAELKRSWSGETLVPTSFTPESFATAEPNYHGDADLFTSSPFASGHDNTDPAEEVPVHSKQDDSQDDYMVSATLLEESDFAESDSEEERPRKLPKLNKDGAPRKPRQPRPKLLKWTDDDWKNVCLGIVWACGETGVHIPFEQAAQVVGEQCTAGALQQALLKLRGKQIAEGYQIPSLKMGWTRKISNATPKTSSGHEANRSRKKPTRVMSTQSHIVTMSRPYVDKDRQGMARPYKWKRSPRCAKPGTLKSSADMKQEDPVTPTRASGTSARAGGTSTRARGASTSAGGTSTRARGVATQAGGSPTRAGGARSHFFDTQASTPTQGNGYLPVTPVTGSRTFTSPSTATFGRNTGFSQGMLVDHGDATALLTSGSSFLIDDNFIDASDDVF